MHFSGFKFLPKRCSNLANSSINSNFAPQKTRGLSPSDNLPCYAMRSAYRSRGLHIWSSPLPLIKQVLNLLYFDTIPFCCHNHACEKSENTFLFCVTFSLYFESKSVISKYHMHSIFHFQVPLTRTRGRDTCHSSLFRPYTGSQVGTGLNKIYIFPS